MQFLQPGETGEAAGSRMNAGTGATDLPRIPEELSLLPMRGLVIFPGAILPLTVTRPASIKLLDETLPLTKVIGLVTQRDDELEEPQPQDLYHVGTAVSVLKLFRQAEDRVVMAVQGLRRFSIRKIVATAPYLRAEVDLPESVLPPPGPEWTGRIPPVARQRGAPACAHSGHAGAGAIDPAQHRRSRTADRFPGAKSRRFMSRKSRRCSRNSICANASAQCRRTSPPSSRSRRSSKSCSRMCSRNSPMRNAALICANR